MADQKLPEFGWRGLTVIWTAIAVCALTAAYSYRHGDIAWGHAFAVFTLFFGLVAVGAHVQRQWNRHGKP